MPEKPIQSERPPVEMFGNVPKEVKEKFSERIGRRFNDGIIEDFLDTLTERIDKLEYEKTSFEKEVIEKANQIINDFLKRYGLPEFNVLEKNIHIIPPELYREIAEDKSTASHYAKQQLVLCNAEKLRESYVTTAKTIFHEIVHLKGFVSFDIKEKDAKLEEEKGYDFGLRRVGLKIFEGYRKSAKDEFYTSFSGLNEAVVSELEQRFGVFIAEQSENPNVQEEMRWSNSEKALELKRNIAKKRVPEKNIDTAIGDIEYINKKGNYNLNSYRSHRRVLSYLAQEIAEEIGKGKGDVADLFFKSHFTGNILEIADLIDKTFGSGQFRVIGMMDDEIKSGNQMLDYLKKQRARVKRIG